jgi:hypothetical protein
MDRAREATEVTLSTGPGDEHAPFVMASDGSDVRQITEFSAFRPRYITGGRS